MRNIFYGIYSEIRIHCHVSDPCHLSCQRWLDHISGDFCHVSTCLCRLSMTAAQQTVWQSTSLICDKSDSTSAPVCISGADYWHVNVTYATSVSVCILSAVSADVADSQRCLLTPKTVLQLTSALPLPTSAQLPHHDKLTWLTISTTTSPPAVYSQWCCWHRRLHCCAHRSATSQIPPQQSMLHQRRVARSHRSAMSMMPTATSGHFIITIVGLLPYQQCLLPHRHGCWHSLLYVSLHGI